jgi:aspartyl protease family protein
VESRQDDYQNIPRRVGKWMIFLAWLVGLALLLVYFEYFLDSERNPNRTVVSQSASDGSAEIVLKRNRYGHYITSGEVNGVRVELMLDTGASDVSVPLAVAGKLGLARGAPRQYRTANGLVTAYATTLDSLRIGTIEVRNVRASINPGLGGEQVLLGMSVLRHVDFSQRGDQLVLRVPSG